MSLGLQCWGCRWRRVRCDSRQPSCSKCLQKGLSCPGYSDTRPLRWRHRITRPGAIVQSRPSPPSPVPRPQLPEQDDIAPSHIILDALTYYNATVAPDLAADGSSTFYMIDISKWGQFNASRRHLTMCIVTLHRAVRQWGDVKHNQALFHYHQACAAEILSHKIREYGQQGPDAALFEDISLFFFSQIQASAYGAWKAHLTAAKTLFNLWGVETLMGNPDYEFFLCHLVLADVFGTTMAPRSSFTTEDISQHKTYLNLLGRFSVDVCSTMVPIPETVVRAITATNVWRALHDTSSSRPAGCDHVETQSPAAILESLRLFDPTEWAAHRPQHMSSQAAGWALLATCFQAAAALYLLRTSILDTSEDPKWPVDDGHDLFYARIKGAIRDLYDLKSSGGVLHKYILWSMVVCGVVAVAQNDEQQVQFLCDLLEQTTIELGTLSMREASVFLADLWKSSKETVNNSAHEFVLDWDTIFSRAPLFLM